MKKIILGAVVIALTATSAFAHDSKKKGPKHTTTITVCKADHWGDTYNWDKNQWETCREVIKPHKHPKPRPKPTPEVKIEITEESIAPLLFFWILNQANK